LPHIVSVQTRTNAELAGQKPHGKRRSIDAASPRVSQNFNISAASKTLSLLHGNIVFSFRKDFACSTSPCSMRTSGLPGGYKVFQRLNFDSLSRIVIIQVKLIDRLVPSASSSRDMRSGCPQARHPVRLPSGLVEVSPNFVLILLVADIFDGLTKNCSPGPQP
jgi:hypothetical protein